MSEATIRGVAETHPGQDAPPVEEGQAVSLLAPFQLVRGIISKYPPPRRPNRNRPIIEADPELREEINDWEAASDEAFEGFENSLPE